MSLRARVVVFGLIAGSITAGLAAAQDNKPRPNFDCAKPGTSIEVIICTDPKLADWDARMGQAYRLRLAHLIENDRRELIANQRQWIETRNSQCNQTQLASAKPCILQMTMARVAELHGTTLSPAPFSPTSILAPEPPVVEKPSQSWDECAGKDHAPPELQIRGCTTVIEGSQEIPENLAIAFGNRGNGYQAEGDYEQAIVDYDQAIQLNPDDPIAFSNRGNAYKSKGNIDRAIADFSEAIKLDPKFAEAYANRGLLKLKRGDAAANEDIASAERLKPALAHELARRQALIVSPPANQESVPLPRARATVHTGPTNTAVSPGTPPSTQSHRGRRPEGCLPDQVCQ